jgi:predicted DNA-binding protein YlxM (UPF0122 family)
LLGEIQEQYRAALSLFYMEDYSYKQIADILEIPLGTVRSRISRGMAQLQQSILMGIDTTLRHLPSRTDDESRSQKIKVRIVEALPGQTPRGSKVSPCGSAKTCPSNQ